MKFIQLRYFCAVCKYGSFSNAAKNLFITQPAIAQSIRELESEFNIRLFDRCNNRLVLTDEGRWLFEKSEELLLRADEISNELRARSQNKQVVKIGVAPMLGNVYFYPLINKLRDAVPEIIPDIREAGSLEIRKWLEGNVIDLGLCLLDCIDSRFATTKLIDVELKFCVHKTHCLAKKKSVSFEEIAKEPVCMLRDDSYQNILLKQKYADLHITPNVMMYSSQLSSIVTILSYGNCGAFMFEHLVRREDDFVTLSLNPKLYLPMGVVWNRQQQVYPPVEKVRKILISFFRQSFR